MKVVVKFLPVLALYALMTSCIPQKKLMLLQEKKPKSGEELIKMADQSGMKAHTRFSRMITCSFTSPVLKVRIRIFSYAGDH